MVLRAGGKDVHTNNYDWPGWAYYTLPKQILDALGVHPEAEVVIELMETGVVIKPKRLITPITERIAAMNLPVADWDQMEQEIEAGRLE